MTQPLDAAIARTEADGDSSTDGPASPTQVRIALWVFVAVVAIAVPLLLWIGSYRWFFGDEWSFLTSRSFSVDGLFAPHNQQHLVALPVLVYRALYSVVGLNAYWPYQLVVIVLHVTVAALLRLIMRRAGVDPWIATAAAGAFIFLGAAEDNILWAFQMTFVGALAAGLGQIILADHDGPIDRRDWLGLGCGFVALLCSGQAPALIMGAGVVCLLRRRWWAAILHTVPLGLIYLAWVNLEEVSTLYRVEGQPFTLRAYGVWMREAAFGLFMGIGHFAPWAILIAAGLVAGIVLAWRSDGTACFLRRAGVPLVLVLVCVVTMTTAAPSRFFLGVEASRAGRYIGVMAALTMPILAVAADAYVRRWRSVIVQVGVCLVFLLPLPFNIVGFGDDELLTPEYFRQERNYVGGLADVPIAAQVPPWIEPNSTLVGQPDMTVGWLLAAKRDGRLPDGQLDAFQLALVPLQLGVAVDPADPPTGLRCETYDRPTAVDPALGDSWVIRDGIRVGTRSGEELPKLWLNLEPPVGGSGEAHIRITLPDLHLVVAPAAGEAAFELCR